MVSVPDNVNKTWAISKSSERLKITCNNIEVVDMTFGVIDKEKYPECEERMGKDVQKIMFYSRYDNASDYYFSASLPGIFVFDAPAAVEYNNC